MASLLRRQHTAAHEEGTTLKEHWGYTEEPVPCTGDANLCTYLDLVYSGHDHSILYIGIMWAIIGGLLISYGISRRWVPARQATAVGQGEKSSTRQSPITRLVSALRASINRHLLPERLRKIFGRTTSLQILILTILTTYVTIFSFVGLTYGLWMTPVKASPGVYRTRTTLGPWSNRIGVFAYALTPLSVLLANRESLLSLLTGIPYQNFQFLHRWLGYIIFLQSTIHTIAWIIIETYLYQPQPKVWEAFVSETYAIWGIVAMFFIAILFILSLPCSIRRTGYETFRKLHYIMAMIFIGGCWGHWQPLKSFLIAALVVWFADRFVRLIRTFLLHYGYLDNSSFMGFRSAQARISYFPDPANGDVVRLDFTHNHAAWQPGQHFYLCFPEDSIWQSHPFTPASLPVATGTSPQPHTYVFRARGGQTRKIAELAQAATTSAETSEAKHENNSALPAALQPGPRSQHRSRSSPTTPVILQGPYGVSHVKHIEGAEDVNILAIAGGTGVTFILPILQYLITLPAPVPENKQGSSRKIELIWIVRRRGDVTWVQSEIDRLAAAGATAGLVIRVFVTREEVEGEGERGAKAALSSEADNGMEKGTGVVVTSEASSSTGGDDGIQELDDKGKLSADALNNTVSSQRVASVFISSSTRTEANSGAPRHPDVGSLVRDFVDSTITGPTTVFASGPVGIVTELRSAVAACNHGSRVWKGDERALVELVCDDRIEW